MKKMLVLLLALTFALFCISGCSEKSLLDPDEPVTLTLWHTYGEQADSPMNRLVSEFNKTVGKEKGIVISVKLMSRVGKIGSQLAEAQSGAPGALDSATTVMPQNSVRKIFSIGMITLQTRNAPTSCRTFLPTA